MLASNVDSESSQSSNNEKEPRKNTAESPQGSVHAAIARTATRSLALFFARPVRLFRPSKINGWQTLKNLASQQGTALSHQYIISLVKLQGIWVIPKHFIPPIIVNASLGAVLWGSYGEANKMLEPYLSAHSLLNSAMSGAIAGACQAIVAAPAENVRILLEQGFGGHSWSCAWKEIFHKKVVQSTSSAQSPTMQEIRQLRGWLQEVGQMAGRGWNGWGWCVGKDTFGFAIFFLLFEVSRRAGTAAKMVTLDYLSRSTLYAQGNQFQRQLPAIANGVTLVTGGVISGLAYEYACRPWDVARRTIYLEKLARPDLGQSPLLILRQKLVEKGCQSFFQFPSMPNDRKIRWSARVLRTAGRVGPWGAGFLVWEAYGAGLS